MSYARGRVTGTTRWNTTLYSLKVTLPQPLAFTPGQYTKLAVILGGELIARPYSIASAPGNHELEFFLVEVEDGPLSHMLSSLTPGDDLLIEEQAYGFLVLNETPPAQDMWLLATGTGIAPFLSMLREGSIFARHQKIVLAQSVRHAVDLAYAEELRQLAKQHTGLCYLPMVSRDRPDKRWLDGRITDRLKDGGLEAAAGTRLDGHRSHLMLCGNPHMIEDTLGLLKARGMRRHRRRAPGQITLEKFW